MPSETRQVEVFRCWDDGHWDTAFVEIPNRTPDEETDDEAIQAGYDAIAYSVEQPFFIGMFCDPGCDDY